MIMLYLATEPLTPLRAAWPGEDPAEACRTTEAERGDSYAVYAVEVETWTVVANADGLRADVEADEEGDGPMLADVFAEVEEELRNG